MHKPKYFVLWIFFKEVLSMTTRMSAEDQIKVVYLTLESIQNQINLLQQQWGLLQKQVNQLQKLVGEVPTLEIDSVPTDKLSD